MNNWSTLQLNRDDGIVTISLHRPEKRNAMNPVLHREMHALLSELRYDPEVRVLVLTGSPPAFCAGQDLKEYFYELAEDEARIQRERIRALSNEWRNYLLRLFPAPTIAAVNGWCFGGAFSLVCACDIAIAADDATFGLSEINFAHFPGGMVTKNITELLRPRDALYYALTGEPFDGNAAADAGLVTRAVPRDAFEGEVRRIAELLRSKDAIALREAKETFKIGRDMDYEEAYAFASAKSNEATLFQRGGWIEKGIGEFLGKKYRPGLEHVE